MNELAGSQDVPLSEIEKKNAIIYKLTAEKNWLATELNHRVRNILQVVLSLLNAQTFYLKDGIALQAVKESQRRMFAISLIHKKLYLAGNSGRIPMRQYIHELIDYLSESFGVRNAITFEQSVEDVLLDVSQAVSVGLILNEAVSNAIKYAFPSGEPAAICIALLQTGAEDAELTVSDNGVGIDRSSAREGNEQLGMSLIRGLAKDLDGTLLMESEKGTKLNIRFKNHITE